MDKNKKLAEERETLAAKQAAHDEQERNNMLRSDASDFVIPRNYIVNASRMKGTEKHVEKLLRGY